MAAIAAIVGAGVTAYSAVSAADANSDANKRSKAGQELAARLAHQQSEDLQTQLEDQDRITQAQIDANKKLADQRAALQQNVLKVGAVLIAAWLITKVL